MPIPSLLPILQRFTQAESRLTDFINRSSRFHEVRSGAMRTIVSRDRYLIAEICFLSLLLEWEIFIEDSFCRMLCRAPRLSPPHPQTNAIFNRIDAAKQALRGRQGFVGWINQDEILHQANTYFRNGEPFSTPIRASYRHLDEIRIVRNRVAHSSEKANSAFQTMIRKQYGFNPRGMIPGRYLLDRLPTNSLANQYFLYAQTLLTVAQLITG